MRLLLHRLMLASLVVAAATTAANLPTRAPLAAAADSSPSPSWLDEQRAKLERVARSLSPADIVVTGLAALGLTGLIKRLEYMGSGLLYHLEREARSSRAGARLRIASGRVLRNAQRVGNVARDARQLGPEVRQLRREAKESASLERVPFGTLLAYCLAIKYVELRLEFGRDMDANLIQGLGRTLKNPASKAAAAQINDAIYESAARQGDREIEKWHDYSRDCGLRSGAIDTILAHRRGVRAKDAAARGGPTSLPQGQSSDAVQGRDQTLPPGGDRRLSVQQMWQQGGEALRTALQHGGESGAMGGGRGGGRGFGSVRVPR